MAMFIEWRLFLGHLHSQTRPFLSISLFGVEPMWALQFPKEKLVKFYYGRNTKWEPLCGSRNFQRKIGLSSFMGGTLCVNLSAAHAWDTFPLTIPFKPNTTKWINSMSQLLPYRNDVSCWVKIPLPFLLSHCWSLGLNILVLEHP